MGWADFGPYRLVASNGCGGAQSTPAYVGRISRCYPNCDGSTTPPFLNVLDFSCFLHYIADGDSRGNCDMSTTPPVINVLDFQCYINAFAAGCSEP